ncbi:small ribosomal subunit protein uS10m [Planococcus citri]|uniref:small ribosomal subunit protein uS10m n=1 Tax=Planococcus citri TaxID=170843 RepID=UPI0031F80BCE
MNSIAGNIIRSAFNNALKYASPRNMSPYCTATGNLVERPTSDEPDKLYKTIEVEMRAYEKATLKSYSEFLKMAADNLDITIGKCFTPLKPFKDYRGLTILRSRFVHKKHRTQYEVRTYFRFMNFHHLTGSTADTFLEYIERNLPEGVALKVTKVALEKLPPEVLTPPVFEQDPTESTEPETNEEQEVQKQ